MIKEKNVCKECWESGYSLKLNKDFLCKKCENHNKIVQLYSDKEIDDELLEWYLKNSIPKKYNKVMKSYNDKEKRANRNFDKIYSKYQEARELEKSGNTDDALKIYLKNLENCPPGTNYYSRPVIILEKQHQYAQAVELCDLAIKNIRIGRFKANEEEFLHRKNRLLKKIEKEKK